MNLGEYIYNDLEKNKYLIQLYRKLLIKYANIQLNIKDNVEFNVIHLLRFADLLSKSLNNNKEEKHKNVAQNIVILLSKIYPENVNVKSTFASVCNSINNYRNIESDNFYNSDIKEFVYQYIEKEKYRIDEDKYFIGDQKKIFDSLNKENIYSYSGPTSIGKTFVIKTFIKKKIKEEKSNFVIVVPTKALITEITSELISDLSEDLKNRNYKIINSHNEMLDEEKNYIMVYTQERFLSFLLNKDIEIQYVFIDEAHKLFSEELRSIYIFKIIDILKGKINVPKIFFSSPLISNPNKFLELFPDNIKKTYSKFEFSPVNQQKYIFDFINSKILIYNDLEENFIELDYNEIKKYNLNKMIKLLGKNQKNLVYCENVQDTINYAKEYANEVKDKYRKCNDKIEKVKKYIIEEIHENYYLVDLLDKGVSYHVGYVPNFVRKKIEELYRNKDIDTMFCTRTLLEGVNLPADNLFIPLKQNSKVLKNDIDFKNLIGRVGRIRYNMSGNVYIIPIKDEEKTITKCKNIIKEDISNKEFPISSVLNLKKKKEIIEKLVNGSTELNKNSRESYEKFANSRYMMNVLIDDIINNRKSEIYKEFEEYIDTKDKIKIFRNFMDKDIPQDMNITLDQINDLEKEINNGLEYPKEITYDSILKFLNKLYDVFNWGKYEMTIKSVGNKNQMKYYSVLLNNWFHGNSINFIIKKSIEYCENQNRVYMGLNKIQPYIGNVEQINFIINNILTTIEQVIKYKIEGYFSKFSEVYKKQKGIEEIENDWYEFLIYGTCKKEIIELQKIGFSREVALKIYRNKSFYYMKDGIVYLKAKIFESKSEEIIDEVKEVYLNNYNRFSL